MLPWVASTILEFAKLHMYKFFYDTLLPHFHPDVPELIMTDTDSVIFSVKCSDFLSKYQKLSQMDFSNFPKNHIIVCRGKTESHLKRNEHFLNL